MNTEQAESQNATEADSSPDVRAPRSDAARSFCSDPPSSIYSSRKARSSLRLGTATALTASVSDEQPDSSADGSESWRQSPKARTDC